MIESWLNKRTWYTERRIAVQGHVTATELMRLVDDEGLILPAGYEWGTPRQHSVKYLDEWQCAVRFAHINEPGAFHITVLPMVQKGGAK